MIHATGIVNGITEERNVEGETSGDQKTLQNPMSEAMSEKVALCEGVS